jgi:hypothetical protein
VIEVAVEARAERPGWRFEAGLRRNQKLVWTIGVVIIVVIGAAVAAIFLGGGRKPRCRSQLLQAPGSSP